MEQTLKAKFTADAQGFLQAINAATNAVNNAGDSWSRRFANAQNAFTALSANSANLQACLEQLAGSECVPEDLVAKMEQVSTYAQANLQNISGMIAQFDELQNAAATAGNYTVEEFQAMQEAAKAAKVPMEDISDATATMNNILTAFGNSSEEATETFKKLGITLENISSKGKAEQMQAIASAIDKLQDPVQRATMGAKVFGSSWENVSKAAKGSGEALTKLRSEGKLITTQAIKDAHSIQNEAQKAAEEAQQLSKDLQSSGEDFKQEFLRHIRTGIEDFRSQLGNAQLAAETFGKSLGKTFGTNPFETIMKGIQALVDIFKWGFEQLEYFKQKAIEAQKEMADDAQILSDKHKKLQSDTDGYMKELAELAQKENLSNTEKVHQAELLSLLSNGYKDLAAQMEASGNSAEAVDKAMTTKLQRDKNQRLRDLRDELSLRQKEYRKQEKIATSGLWGMHMTKKGAAAADQAAARMKELDQAIGELQQEIYEVEKSDPAQKYKDLQEAKKKDAEARQNDAAVAEAAAAADEQARQEAAAAELQDTMDEAGMSKFDIMRRNAERKAAEFAQRMGVGMDDQRIQDFLNMQNGIIDDQENADRDKASQELKTIIHQSTLDKYQRMREEAEQKVKDMILRTGKDADNERIRQYRELLEKEIAEKEKAEREKAAAAAAAESRRAAEESRRNAVQAAGERARERAQARKDELQRQIGKFGFSISNPELLDETSSERRARNRQARQDARIQEKLDTLESGKGVVFTARERERIQQLQDLQKEFDEIDPAQAAAEAQQEAADRLSDAADKLADAAETLVKGGPKNPEITEGLHRDSSKSFIIKKGRDDEEKKGNEKKGEETEGKDDGNKQGGLFGFGSEGERFSLRGARQSAGGIFQGLDYRTMEEKQRELEEQMAIKFPDIPEPSDYSSQIQQVIATLQIMAKHNYIIKG